MRYCDFKKIEATYYFIQDIKNGKKSSSQKDDNNKVKEQLSGLKSATPEELNLPPEYLEIFN